LAEDESDLGAPFASFYMGRSRRNLTGCIWVGDIWR